MNVYKTGGILSSHLWKKEKKPEVLRLSLVYKDSGRTAQWNHPSYPAQHTGSFFTCFNPDNKHPLQVDIRVTIV